MFYFNSYLARLHAEAKGCRKFILKFILLKLLRDPEIQFSLEGKKLIAPASHDLPSYLAEFPFYDRLVKRISDFLRAKSGKLVMIDVGANIGDTIVASHNSQSDKFLAVEAHGKFVRFLKRNCAEIPNLLIMEAFLTSEDRGEMDVSIVESHGTARIAPGDSEKIVMRTLDSIVSEYSNFRDVNFLKIDTDGNDFMVIRGGRGSISRATPTILFEADVFGNEEYLSELEETFSFLREAGYSMAMLYDNFGNLFGAYSLDSLADLRFPLFYQLTSTFYYFDILVMEPRHAQEFLKEELMFFSNYSSSNLLKQLAKQALTFPDFHK